MWISFESLKTASPEEFYDDFDYQLRREFAPDEIETVPTIKNQVTLRRFFGQLQTKPLVLIIAEFEGIPDDVLSEVMHALRQIYHKKEDYALHALILVGVSTIADLVIGPASPFNIADQLGITYFTEAEVVELINQYVAESGQRFDEAVVKAVYVEAPIPTRTHPFFDIRAGYRLVARQWGGG